MSKVIDENYIRLLQSLHLNLSIRAKNNRLGKRRSLAKGSSVEFSDFREYVHGDDFRRIDWNALARFEKLFIKLYAEEQESPVSIVLDVSKSMGFDAKREVAIKTAALFAYTSIREYDPVTLYLHNNTLIAKHRNISTNAGFYRMVDVLEKQVFDRESNLYDAVTAAYTTIKKGYTIIVSDLLYEHQLEEVLKLLAFKKQHVIVCHVLSENDINPSFADHVRLKDSELFEELDLDVTDHTMDIYRKNFDNYISDIKVTCDKYMANYFMINADEQIEKFVYELNRLTPRRV